MKSKHWPATQQKADRLRQSILSVNGELLYFVVHGYQAAKFIVIRIESRGTNEAEFVGQLLDALSVLRLERKQIWYVTEPRGERNPYFDHLFTPFHRVVFLGEE